MAAGWRQSGGRLLSLYLRMSAEQALSSSGLQPALATAGTSHLLPALLEHSRSLSTSRMPKRPSSFQNQKQKALVQDQPSTSDQQPSQPGSTALVTIQPNQTNASLQQVAQVVDHPALIVTRPIEWGTVIFGFEQANRYTVYDQDGQVVAHLMEDYTGLGNELGRQVLRTRRSFTATVLSADGSQVIFKLRRPMYLINSTMYVEDAEGHTVGEVHQRWHPIKRNYDLYINKQQFATISGNFLAWEFELKDGNGGTLALLDRNFQGFGKELFTDAGKYVIHFGVSAPKAAEMATQTIEARSGTKVQHPVTPMAMARTDVAVIPTTQGGQLAVVRELKLDERMIALAAAISVDYNYFSQHSHTSGWFHPPLFMPLPGGGTTTVPASTDIPPTTGTGPDTAGAASAGAAGEVAGGDFGAGSAGSGGYGAAASSQGSGEMHLGGDEFVPPSQEGGWGGMGDGEMKWDLPSGGGGGDEGAGAGGLLAMIWAMVFGE